MLDPRLLSGTRLVLETWLLLDLLFFFGRHTAVLLIAQYARMTQCTTVLLGDVQLALWHSPLDPALASVRDPACIRDPASIRGHTVMIVAWASPHTPLENLAAGFSRDQCVWGLC